MRTAQDVIWKIARIIFRGYTRSSDSSTTFPFVHHIRPAATEITIIAANAAEADAQGASEAYS